MVPDTVRTELRSPILPAAALLLAAVAIYGLLLGRLMIVWPIISIVVTLYLLYLFIRLVVAVETIAYET